VRGAPAPGTRGNAAGRLHSATPPYITWAVLAFR
jgi:hypothetical protein